MTDHRRVSLLLGVLFGLTGLGSSSAAIALPLLGPDLGVSVGVATWTISLYTLMLAVTTAVYGRISDLVGVRWPLLIGVALMTGGALIAALAPTFSVLLAARMLQGVGAAAVPTLGVAALSARYDGEVRGAALSRLAGMAAAISCLGPLLGGLLEHVLGWRAVMALPILAALVLPFVWDSLVGEGTGARLDLLGAVLVASTAGGLVLLIQSPSSGVTVAVIGVVLLAVGLPSVALWVRRVPMGFLPLSVLQNPTVIRTAVAAAAIPASWFALLVGAPAVLVGKGWEPWQVGVLLVPSAAVALVLPRFVGPALGRYGPARVLGYACWMSSLSILLSGIGTAVSSVTLLVLTVVLTTLAFGFGQPAMTAAVGEAVHSEVRGVALGVATLLFLVGGAVGSAWVGGLGEAVGIPASLMLLAFVPLAGVAVIRPELAERRP